MVSIIEYIFHLDPCNASNHQCHTNSTCVNMGQNTTKCRCDTGYYLINGTTVCQPIIKAYVVCYLIN